MATTDRDWARLRLTYGITPPRASWSEPRRRKTASIQAARVAALPIDALVIYDLQDESSRTEVERPFPLLETVDPLTYAFDDLGEIDVPRIVYRSVSGQDPASLRAWMQALHGHGGAAVFVGAPSRTQAIRMKLGEAYALRAAERPDLPLGGVMIAERHETRGNEDERVLAKVDRGCSFFISQAVFSVTTTKNLLSDLHYRCQAQGRPVPPVLVTLSPCGSVATLEFMRWLGVSVPRWLQNELVHAQDILARSVELSLAAFEELLDFARHKRIPLGCNVESVSRRKAEIDASVDMVARVAGLLDDGDRG